MIASPPAARLRGRNVLAVTDLGADELGSLLAIASSLKARGREQLTLLRGKTLVMLFEKPSLRTRVSFETGMTQLGGHAIAATGSEFGVGTRETQEDAARVLSRYGDAIVYRTHAHEPLIRFAAASTVPTINALSEAAHPCQAFADLLTIRERFGTLQGLRLAYVGDARNNVAISLAEAAAMCGISLTFAAPPTHRPPDAFLGRLVKLGAAHNVTARAFTSPIRAVRDVDVIYTDVWTSMGEEQYTERNRAALRPYQVNAELMSAAAPHALFMHCLPAHRGEEVTVEVIDGPRSVVFDQAENRLHAQKALLLALLTDLRGLTE
ncbi:MAG: ornithine carbamoyltransferase [Candidatus Eremiobacteraeota bacterium]|nr:ornithine carbamoyltransferase [Candidatus Eremiobacteraeota bacterium]